MALLSLCIPSAPGHASQWQIECADCPRFFPSMSNRSIAVDGRGYPHIVYGGDHLYHAWCDHGGWHTEVVDDSPGVGRHASMCVTRSECLHAVYSDWPNSSLKYAVFDRGGWEIQTVDTASAWCYIRWPSVAVDDAGQVHLSYHDAYDYRSGSWGPLLYARRDESGWTIEVVDEGHTGTGVLRLGPSAQPRILYDRGGFLRTLAARSDTGWTIEILPERGHLQDHASLVVDEADRFHVAMDRYGLMHPLYLVRDESGWQVEVVSDSIRVGGAQSMVLDSAGTPIMAFVEWDPVQVVCVATKEDVGWAIAGVDTATITGNPSLALCPSGGVHLCYTRQPSALAHAVPEGDSWQIALIDSSRRTGLFVRLAVGTTGVPHITYADGLAIPGYTERDLRYARRQGSAWSFCVVDPAYRFGSTSSLALDTSGNPRISFAEYPSGGLHHTTLNGGVWHDEMVASNARIAPTAIAVDAIDRTHLAWVLKTPCGLGYGYQTEAGWQLETVALGSLVAISSMTTDATGSPHITYSTGIMGSGRAGFYAWKDSEGWVIESPPEWSTASVLSEPAVDGAGRAHVVAACPAPDQALLYSRRDATGWHTDTVVSGAPVRAASLALDGGGRPRILYRTQEYTPGFPYNACLWFAWKDAQGWHVEPVVEDGGVGPSCRLAVDSEGVVHIAFYDEALEDLNYGIRLGLSGDPAAQRPVTQCRLLGPVPCAGRARFALTLPREMSGEITVFDLLGRRVRTVAGGSFAAGVHLLTWDGLTDARTPAADGTYVLRARLGAVSPTCRIVLLR